MDTAIRVARLTFIIGVTGLAGGCATTRDAVPAASRGPIIDQHPEELVGPETRLAIDHGVLTGRAKGGLYDVQIRRDGATGIGPFGPIDVRVTKRAEGYRVEGTWNGGPMSFVVSDKAIRGTALRQVSDEDRGFESCWYDVEKLLRQSSYAGREECEGTNSPVRFDVPSKASIGLSDEETAVLIIAYVVTPPTVE
jgi:hypothetical protein